MCSARPQPSSDHPAWSTRWPALARAARIEPEEKLLLALSGGADSVLLLHWLAASEPPVRLRAVHVDHGLRGEESAADARFCANLARALGVPFRCLRAELGPGPGSLEARARAERYRLLVREAEQSGQRTIVTGHHRDDALETLLQRWIRGTDPAGLYGPRPALVRRGEQGPVRIVRPLLTLRREEVRALLAERGLRWREDSSNRDPRFTRTRVRHGFLPALRELCGPAGVAQLAEFGRAVEELETGFARATAHLAWRPAPYAELTRPGPGRLLGGVLERRLLSALPAPLARRVLLRLLTEGTGRAPSLRLLERILDDLSRARCTRHALPAGWTLVLRARELLLLAPAARAATGRGPERARRPVDPGQLWLPFPDSGEEARSCALALPGAVRLADGRRLSAELRRTSPDAPPPRSALCVELDAAGLDAPLAVRWPASGDRFRALGAPGSKPLTRFLADRGIPREERARIPLVSTPEEILWVAGLEPCERRRLSPRTELRLRLTLHVSAG